MDGENKRCFGDDKPFYAQYHDEEWGIPVHDDRQLFEMLCLEGAQAGLSWETVLKKREGYRCAFHNFEIARVASMNDDELEKLREEPAIIRNRLKIFSVRKNAIASLEIQKEYGSLDAYLWAFVNHTPTINHWKNHSEVPASTDISSSIAKDLKKRGMSFVGSTIVYAFMQATGMVNDHLVGCPTRAVKVES